MLHELFPQLGAVKSILLMAVMLIAIVHLAILIDLVSGVRKAKRLGLLRTSYGFRRTVGKVNQYMLFIGGFLCVDLALAVVGVFDMLGANPASWATLLACLICLGIEIKSIWENAPRHDQKRITDVARTVLELTKSLDNKKELAEAISQLLASPSSEPKTDKQ